MYRFVKGCMNRFIRIHVFRRPTQHVGNAAGLLEIGYRLDLHRPAPGASVLAAGELAPRLGEPVLEPEDAGGGVRGVVLDDIGLDDLLIR